MTHGKKVNDLLVNEEAFWFKYVEELEDKKSPWLVNSSAGDALVCRDRAGLGDSDKLADILYDWLDTFDSVVDGDILWVKFAMIFSDAEKDEKKNYVRNLAHDWQYSADCYLHYP